LHFARRAHLQPKLALLLRIRLAETEFDPRLHQARINSLYPIIIPLDPTGLNFSILT